MVILSRYISNDILPMIKNNHMCKYRIVLLYDVKKYRFKGGILMLQLKGLAVSIIGKVFSIIFLSAVIFICTMMILKAIKNKK